MDNYTTLVLGSTLALSFLYIIIAKICSIRGIKKLPPGPSPWPIIGNFHLLGTKPHRSLVNLAQIYGPIMSLKIGQKTIVVISSSTMAKQVLQKQDLAFSNRFITNALQAHMYSKFSVACLPVCPQWRMLRKILNKSVFSSNKLDANEHLRSQKVKELIAYCAKCSQQGKALDICQAVFKTNFNLMCSTLFSKDLADPFSDSKVKINNMILFYFWFSTHWPETTLELQLNSDPAMQDSFGGDTPNRCFPYLG